MTIRAKRLMKELKEIQKAQRSHKDSLFSVRFIQIKCKLKIRKANNNKIYIFTFLGRTN